MVAIPKSEQLAFRRSKVSYKSLSGKEYPYSKLYPERSFECELRDLAMVRSLRASFPSAACTLFRQVQLAAVWVLE